jgi:hypothetical protein
MEVENLHACIDDLKHTGRLTLENIETGEAELAASGLVYLFMRNSRITEQAGQRVCERGRRQSAGHGSARSQ